MIAVPSTWISIRDERLKICMPFLAGQRYPIRFTLNFGGEIVRDSRLGGLEGKRFCLCWFVTSPFATQRLNELDGGGSLLACERIRTAANIEFSALSIDDFKITGGSLIETFCRK